MKKDHGPYLKAIWTAFAAGAIASLSSLITAFQGENTGWDTITPSQWLTALLFFFFGACGAGGTTYTVQNRASSDAIAGP